MKKKIISIAGARPQFIKYAPLSIALQESFEDICIHTGQHYDDKMSQIFFDELGITKPKYHLNIGPGNQGAQTGRMIEGIEKILLEETPSAIIVFGDTTSTLAGAIAASKIGVKIIHIEAGLRSFNRDMPEEINRVLTDHASDLFFVPTSEAISNLKNEGITENVFSTGDLMIDTQRIGLEYLNNNENQYIVKIPTDKYILATIHRNYNTDDFTRLEKILLELNQTKEKVILPIHPRTEKMLAENGFDMKDANNISFIEPQGYFDFLNLLNNCSAVVTDSGGLQKEAYSLKKPCVTLRYETEWIETLENGCNVLIGENLGELKTSIKHVPVELFKQNIYGNGYGAQEIVKILNETLN